VGKLRAASDRSTRPQPVLPVDKLLSTHKKFAIL
jgi:hypothetical protein